MKNLQLAGIARAMFANRSAWVFGAAMAVAGAANCVFRAKKMEKRLAEKFAPESVARVKVGPEDLNSDMHASAEYRSHLITVLAQRAVEAAIAGK